MNKKELSKLLSKKIDLDEKECLLILNILEKYPLIGENARLKIINELTFELNIDRDKAVVVYNATRELIKNGIKESLKHPFRSKD